MGYEGHLQPLLPGPEKERVVTQAMRSTVDSAKCLEDAGISAGIVSCGGSGDYSIAGSYPGVTEIQAGSYLLMDTWYAPYAPDFRLAQRFGYRDQQDPWATHRVGCRRESHKRGAWTPCCERYGRTETQGAHAEHAPVEIVDRNVNVNVGDKIEISVQYHDGTIHLHNCMFGVHDSRVERVFQIEH